MRPFRTLGVAVALALGGTLMTPAAFTPASADNLLTPRDFTGYGFDQCLGPTQAAMDAWLEHSPYLAVGIYISGASRGCRDQPNLTPTWITTQLNRGWRLLPITLGPQASCHPDFPRYGNDPDIDDDPGPRGLYGDARRQGRREASRAIIAASALGIARGSTLWYDLEGFDDTNTRCRESAMAFLSGWTVRLQDRGWVSGVYSSAGSGIEMLDRAREAGRDDIRLPNYIWIARWDGIPNTSTSYISEEGWNPHRRVKQYRGGHLETWGGVTINIDNNYLDVGRGTVARAESHCGGVRIGFARYQPLVKGTPRRHKVRALQCLLKERDYYGARLHGRYGVRTRAAVRRWQAARGFPLSNRFRRWHWTALLTQGGAPVLKYGSGGGYVRRVQRGLNALGAGLDTHGLYGPRTDRAVRDYQVGVGIPASGVVNTETWAALQAGRYRR